MRTTSVTSILRSKPLAEIVAEFVAGVHLFETEEEFNQILKDAGDKLVRLSIIYFAV
jgi:hypothetical protein